MSKIQKVAVTDARLMQEEPAYAVQKGALSVSVAPFSAIAASSSQMTFQVLVPSLNVFIDRKILLASPLSFNANVYFGGARGASYRVVYVCVSTGSVQANVSTFNTSKISTAGTALAAATTMVTAAAAITAQIAAGQPPLVLGAGFAPGTVLTAFTTVSDDIATIAYQPPTVAIMVATSPFLIASYVLFDVPDPQLSMSQGHNIGIGLDMGQSLSAGGLPNGPSGWCSAVSGKDLALTQFPIQSCISTMTATLNDCTVTTNGDTLREQLMLTSTRDNLKQRTTPTNADVYSWGRDDVQNNGGNFSTYSTANGYGDIANGAWPIAWSSNAICAAQLQSVVGSDTVAEGAGTAPAWPFLGSGIAKSFFQSTALGAGNAVNGGVGFYIAPAPGGVTRPTTPTYTSGNVLVPFLNYQPVWTTGFPGGDLLGSLSSTNLLYTACTGANNFVVTMASATLTLNVAVPPMSMVGARLYDALAGNFSTSTAPTAAANTSATGVIAIVTSLKTGGLGQVGSTYGITYSSVSGIVTFTTVSAVSPAGHVLALSGGCPVGYQLPVYGTINCAEALVISPLIWADSAEFQAVGLYGMTNMQFVINFSPLGTTKAVLSTVALTTAGTLSGNASRARASLPLWIDDLTVQNPNTGNILRSSNVRSVLSDLTYAAASGSSGPWAGGPSAAIATTSGTTPTLYATFLTPGVDVPLPEVSTVPYCEFPRYFYQTGQSLNTAAPTISSQTISLTSIPDMVMIYVKPNTRGPSQLDQYMPIKSLSVTFDNFSNLCSSFQQVNLYESAVAAGLDMDWNQWRGFTQAQYPSGVIGDTAATTAGVGYTKQSPFTQLSGGPILLRMGTDITLQPGLAPGCLGNYSFQVGVTIDNSKGYYNYVNNPVITVIAINTGFFETMRGQSAIRKTILQMADVAAATSDEGMSKTNLNRMIGRGSGGGMFSGASNLLSRGLAAARQAKKINDQYGLTNLARTYGGTTGANIADMAEGGLNAASKIDSLYGNGKRHRSSGIM